MASPVLTAGTGSTAGDGVSPRPAGAVAGVF